MPGTGCQRTVWARGRPACPPHSLCTQHPPLAVNVTDRAGTPCQGPGTGAAPGSWTARGGLRGGVPSSCCGQPVGWAGQAPRPGPQRCCGEGSPAPAPPLHAGYLAGPSPLDVVSDDQLRRLAQPLTRSRCWPSWSWEPLKQSQRVSWQGGFAARAQGPGREGPGRTGDPKADRRDARHSAARLHQRRGVHGNLLAWPPPGSLALCHRQVGGTRQPVLVWPALLVAAPPRRPRASTLGQPRPTSQEMLLLRDHIPGHRARRRPGRRPPCASAPMRPPTGTTG